MQNRKIIALLFFSWSSLSFGNWETPSVDEFAVEAPSANELTELPNTNQPVESPLEKASLNDQIQANIAQNLLKTVAESNLPTAKKIDLITQSISVLEPQQARLVASLYVEKAEGSKYPKYPDLGAFGHKEVTKCVLQRLNCLLRQIKN